MWIRLLMLVLALSLAACGGSGAAEEAISIDAGTGNDHGSGKADFVDVVDTATNPTFDSGPVPEQRVVLEGKDPGEATYEFVASDSVDGVQLEEGDRLRDRRATGTIDGIGERDILYVRGDIEDWSIEGNIVVTIDGEIRKNGLQTLEGEPEGEKPTIEVTIHSSVELIERNGRVGEVMVATYASRAFEKAGFGYHITYNFFPQRPPDEKSNCSAGDAPQWWAEQVQTAEIGRAAKDANILMLNARGGGCGAVGGKYGTTPARYIDEMRAWTPVGSDDWHRNMHGTLHEIGHQLGARHDHDDETDGAQHPGNAWNETDPDGKIWWHRTPNTAGNGAPNLCGTAIEKRQSRPNVKRHQTYSECAVQNFQIASPDE